MKYLCKSNYTKSMWKNGKGFTNEILIYPQTSSVKDNNFLWRLSSAEVRENGPFSRFPGYERLLFVVKGSGLHLQSKNRSQKILPLSSYAFGGHEDVYASLVDGPIIDINFIYRPDKFPLQYGVLSSWNSTEWEEATYIFYAATGDFMINKTKPLLLGDSLLVSYKRVDVLSIEAGEDPSAKFIFFKLGEEISTGTGQ